MVQAYKRGEQYHISLIMEWELDQAPDSARLREALAHVASEFAQPKDAVLEVKDVQPNHVCVLNPNQLLFQGSINNIKYMRMDLPGAFHFGLPEPSISM